MNEIFKSFKNHNFTSNRSKTLGLVSFDSIFLVFYWLKFPVQSAERSLRKMDLKNDNRKKNTNKFDDIVYAYSIYHKNSFNWR